MGATVSTACAVSAFRDRNNGGLYYIMWEETYEKNVHPHTPSWRAIHVGGQASIIEAVFRNAHVCEGGMLQGRGGHITPEGYIQRWMKALKEPFVIHEGATFELSMTGWRAAIDPNNLEMVQLLLEHRLDRELSEMRQGKTVNLPVHEYGELLTRLRAMGVSAWKMFVHARPIGFGGPTDPNLALDYSRPGAGRYTPPIPSMARIENSVYIEGEDGVYRNEGWGYSIVGSFVANFWQIEIEHPGSYKSAIKAYREAVKAAPKAEDMNLLVEIDATKELQYGEGNRKRLLELLGGKTRMPLNAAMETLRQTGDAYEIPFGEKYVTLRKPGITGALDGGRGNSMETQAQLSLIA